MKVLFITNIPSPYRIDFFNKLGKQTDLTVIFEARRAHGLTFDWNNNEDSFQSVYLSNGYIQEKKINFKIFKLLRKKRYDCVFVTNYGYLTELAAVLFLQALKIPYVLEVDGMVPDVCSRWKSRIKTRVISKAEYIFSPGRLSDFCLIRYGAGKNKIIRYPFSSLSKKNILDKPVNETERNRIRKELHIASGIMILYAGRFIPGKGLDVLLKAFNRLPDNCQLYLIGGDASEILINLIDSDKKDRVHFCPFMNTVHLREYYKAADVFILPTRKDVWGLVVNEAMAQGLPVITTKKCGAGMELVRNNGLLIEPDNEQELASAVMKIVQNPEKLYQMREDSLKIIQKYTIENAVRVHCRFFREHMQSGRERGK